MPGGGAAHEGGGYDAGQRAWRGGGGRRSRPVCRGRSLSARGCGATCRSRSVVGRSARPGSGSRHSAQHRQAAGICAIQRATSSARSRKGQGSRARPSSKRGSLAEWRGGAGSAERPEFSSRASALSHVLGRSGDADGIALRHRPCHRCKPDSGRHRGHTGRREPGRTRRCDARIRAASASTRHGCRATAGTATRRARSPRLGRALCRADPLARVRRPERGTHRGQSARSRRGAGAALARRRAAARAPHGRTGRNAGTPADRAAAPEAAARGAAGRRIRRVHHGVQHLQS